MAYSCTDFFDDVMRALVDAGAISASDIPADDPGQGADIACAAIVSMSRTGLSSRFMNELLHEVESLGAVAEQYGPPALAFLFYLQAAILNDTYIEAARTTDAQVMELVQRLQSAAEWMKHIQTVAEA